MPDLVGEFREFDALHLSLAEMVEEAQFDLGGVGGKKREIDAPPIPGRAERIWPALEHAAPLHR